MTRQNRNAPKSCARSDQGSSDKNKPAVPDNFELGGMNRWRQVPVRERDLAES